MCCPSISSKGILTNPVAGECKLFSLFYVQIIGTNSKDSLQRMHKSPSLGFSVLRRFHGIFIGFSRRHSGGDGTDSANPLC